MAGVFIAYFRDDQRLARRVRNALASLGVDVIWDEEMPGGVPWRQWIADNIESLAAVVVLWTPGSITRANVHEEAMEGVKGKKLISVMHNIDQPPLGYAKDNISRLESWEAGKPDSGWRSFVAEVDSKIATSNGGQRPGSLIAMYNSQLEEVRTRKAELAVAEREGKQRMSLRTKLVKACEKAEKQVERDEQSLADVQGAQMATRPKMAAMKAADEELEIARKEQSATFHRLDEFDDSREQAELELEYKRKNLDEYLVFIGGSGEGSGAYIPPPPPPQEPPVRVLQVDSQEGLQEQQTGMEPEEAKSDDDLPMNHGPPIDGVPAKPLKSERPAALFGILEWLKSLGEARTRRLGVLVGLILAVCLIWWLFGPRQAVESDPVVPPEVVASKPVITPAAPKPSLSFAEERRQTLGWLLDHKWSKRQGCTEFSNSGFRLSDDGNVLLMGFVDVKGGPAFKLMAQDPIVRIGPGNSVTTKTLEWKAVGPDNLHSIYRGNDSDGNPTEFVKCAR